MKVSITWETTITCQYCNGEGRRWEKFYHNQVHKIHCSYCGGKGTVTKKHEKSIKLWP